MDSGDRFAKRCARVYRVFLRALPHRDAHETAAVQHLFERLVTEAFESRGRAAAVMILLRSILDVLHEATRRTLERFNIRRGGAPEAGRLDSMLTDLRHSARALLRRPGFTALACITLALGIGANSALFGVVSAVLLRDLPYDSPDRVVRLAGTRGGELNRGGTLSYLNARDVAATSASFEGVAAYDEWTPNLTGEGEPERLTAAQVNVEFFDVLGVRPALGRFFLREEDIDGRDRVVVLSHGLWQSRFAGDPSVVGRSIRLNGNAHEIVGVVARDFEDPRLGGIDEEPRLWRPLGYGGLPLEEQPNRGSSSYVAVARLKPGVSVEQSRAELATISRVLEETYPVLNPRVGMTALPLKESMVGDVRGTLLLLLGAVGLVLAIAAANVGSLLLGRAAERRREVALRVALGASRARITGLLVTETLLLAVAGGVLGVGVAVALVRVIMRLGESFVPRGATVSIDATVLAFTACVTVLTGLACALVPAWLAARADLRSSMGEGARIGGGSRRAAAYRRALVTAEVTLALVLLVGAGLLGKSLWRLLRVDVGIETENLLTFEMVPPSARYPDVTAVHGLYDELLARLSRLPEVRSAAAVNIVPLGGGFDCNPVTRPDRPPPPPGERVCAEVRTVTPQYFETAGLARRGGREFDARDRAGSPPVVLIGETLARDLWPGEEPVGMRLALMDTVAEVIGVVADVKHLRLEEAAPPMVYMARDQSLVPWHLRQMSVAVRLASDAGDAGAAVRAVVRAIDDQLALANVRTMREIITSTSAPPRFRALLLGLFAALALALAAVGIYGVVSFAVTQRTREMAIRLAVGAHAGDILRLVLRQGLAPVLVGLALGLTAALAGSRILGSVLFDVQAADPLTFLAVPVLLLGIAALAAFLPARRATRVDPMMILRQD